MFNCSICFFLGGIFIVDMICFEVYIKMDLYILIICKVFFKSFDKIIWFYNEKLISE